MLRVTSARDHRHTNDTPEYQNGVGVCDVPGADYRGGMAASTAPVRIVSPRRALIVLVIVCALFTAMGVVVLLLAPTQTLNVIVGTGAVAFFGIGGGSAFITQWRRTVPLRADDDGIALGGGGRIDWADVDRIGATTTALGIRLRRYDAFLASVPRSSGYTAESLRASRAQNAGWDLTWPTRLLDRTPGEAARDLQRRRPAD